MKIRARKLRKTKILNQKQPLNIKRATKIKREGGGNFYQSCHIPTFHPMQSRFGTHACFVSCQQLCLITNGNMNSQFECENKLKLRLYHLFASTLQLTSNSSIKENWSRDYALLILSPIDLCIHYTVLTSIKSCRVNSKSDQSLTVFTQDTQITKMIARSKSIQ